MMKKTKLKKLVEKIVDEKIKETIEMEGHSQSDQLKAVPDDDDYKFDLPRQASRPGYDGRAGA